MSDTDCVIVVQTDGAVRFVWDDRLAGMVQEGDPTISRASDVEPTAGGLWLADMGRVGGPVFGPFRRRDEAIRRERELLVDCLIGGSL